MQTQTTLANMISSSMYVRYQAIEAYLSMPRMDKAENGLFLRPTITSSGGEIQVTRILYRWLHEFVGDRFEVGASVPMQLELPKT